MNKPGRKPSPLEIKRNETVRMYPSDHAKIRATGHTLQSWIDATLVEWFGGVGLNRSKRREKA